ncbi:MAG: acyl-CoA thioesterase [Salibacteraceae bacterium]
MSKYTKTIEVRWSDVDQNRHVRHSAYYDYCAFTRVSFITSTGYDASELEKIKIGPILFKEECTFLRELKPDDVVTVNILKGEMPEDGSKWTIHHEIFNKNGEKAAHVTVLGAWIDLEARRLTKPPKDLALAFYQLTQGSTYTHKSQSQ